MDTELLNSIVREQNIEEIKQRIAEISKERVKIQNLSLKTRKVAGFQIPPQKLTDAQVAQLERLRVEKTRLQDRLKELEE